MRTVFFIPPLSRMSGGLANIYGLALRPLPAANGTAGGQKTTVGVVMYCSDDLYNWAYEGVILPCSSDPSSNYMPPCALSAPR